MEISFVLVSEVNAVEHYFPTVVWATVPAVGTTVILEGCGYTVEEVVYRGFGVDSELEGVYVAVSPSVVPDWI